MFNTLKLSRNKTIIYQGIDLNISYDTLFKLRSQKNIAIEAIKQDKRAYDFIVPELREDEEIKNIMNPPEK